MLQSIKTVQTCEFGHFGHGGIFPDSQLIQCKSMTCYNLLVLLGPQNSTDLKHIMNVRNLRLKSGEKSFTCGFLYKLSTSLNVLSFESILHQYLQRLR